MLKLWKCAKDNSKIFLLKIINCQLAISNLTENIWTTLIKHFKKDAEIRLDVPKILLFKKNHL